VVFFRSHLEFVTGTFDPAEQGMMIAYIVNDENDANDIDFINTV